MERLLDKVVMLFRYLQDKDIFEKYYKQHGEAASRRALGLRRRRALDDHEAEARVRLPVHLEARGCSST